MSSVAQKTLTEDNMKSFFHSTQCQEGWHLWVSDSLRQDKKEFLVCMPFVYSKNSNYLITNLASVRPVGKALFIARDVDLTGSGWNSLCTWGAKELKLTPAGKQNNSNNHTDITSVSGGRRSVKMIKQQQSSDLCILKKSLNKWCAVSLNR